MPEKKHEVIFMLSSKMIDTLPVRDLATSKGDKNWTSIIKFNKNTWMKLAPRGSCWLKSRGFVMNYHTWGFVVVKNKIINTTVTKTPQQAPADWNLCHPDQQDIPAECQGQGKHSEVPSITHPFPVLLFQAHNRYFAAVTLWWRCVHSSFPFFSLLSLFSLPLIQLCVMFVLFVCMSTEQAN